MPFPSDATAAPDSSFSLESTPGRVRISQAQLDSWSRLYARDHRQLRRWIALGLQTDDPCPLDDPAGMPSWWQRHMKHQVPAALLVAARNATPPTPPPPVLDAESQNRPGAIRGSTQQTPDAATPPADHHPASSIDLSAADLADGDEVRQAARLVQTAYDLLEQAYAGNGGDVDLLQRRWEKATETLRKAKIQDEARRKRLGDLIARADVQRDLDLAAELHRQMRTSMTRQVLELCPSLDPIAREQVAAAIESVRAKEERVFRNLDSLKRNADVFELTAA